MRLRARHRGIDELHDAFFNRVEGRTVSAAHFDDSASELHYHELTFHKRNEPPATIAVVPVSALVRPHFALSRQRVTQLQHLLVSKSNELLKVLDSFELAQLHYCIGAVHMVAWLPLEEGDLMEAPALERVDPDSIDRDRGWFFVDGVRYCLRCRTRRCKRQAGGTLACIQREAPTNAGDQLAAVRAVVSRVLEDDGATSGVVKLAEELDAILQARQAPAGFPPFELYQQVIDGAPSRTASGSPSEGAALSGRAERAVPPEASPEGRTDSAEVIARVAASPAPELTGTEPTEPVLHPLHSVDVEIDNRTEFAITADATFFGSLPAQGARYELQRCVLTIRNVEPKPGAIWPE